MRLSTKGRYAVTAMLNLAIHEGKGPITLLDISQSQGISLSYLEQLFAKLRRDGLVEGVRGPGGGYRLAKPAAAVSIADIIAAVDERVDATVCERRENSQIGERCLSHDLWTSLSKQIFDYLAAINLADFLARPSIHALIERHGDGDQGTPETA